MSKQSKAALALKRIRERADMSVREVADALKRPPSTYAAYEDKYKKQFLPIDLVKELVPIFSPRGIEASELLELAGVSDAYDPAAESKTHALQGNVQGMAAIDELDVAPAAGDGANVGDAQVVRTWSLPQNVVSIATESPVDRIKILRVKGDSMMPTYNPLDRIMVDIEDKSPSPGGVFVVWDGLGLVVKRVQFVPHSDPPTVKIASDNPKYDTYQRSLNEAFIQGRVIGKWLWT